MPADPRETGPGEREHAAAEGPPNAAGEFTQIFSGGGVPQQEQLGTPDASRAPFDDDFARMFGTAPDPTANRATDVSPQARQDDATLIFEAITEARAPAARPDVAPQRATPPSGRDEQAYPPRPPAPMAGDFTQVFSPLAPPTAPPPELQAATGPAPAAPSGEFTQFFSAISARDQAAAAPSASAGARMPVAPAGASRMPPAPQAPAAPASPAAGSFTQLFQQEPARERNAPAMPAQPAVAAFQPVPPPSSSPFFDPAAASFSASSRAPGTFTDIFAAQPSRPSAASEPWPSSMPPAAAPVQQEGAFTELFQSVPTAAPPSSPFAAPSPFAPAPPSSSPVAPAWPSAAPAQGGPLAPGGGEFTRLMQSLSPSAQGSMPAPPARDAFFTGNLVAGAGAGQESEFTRVQRSSAQRNAAAPAPLPPAASAAGSPGVAMAAAPKAADAQKDPPAKKSRLLVVSLIVMNVLLLVALVVLAVLVLRRR